MAKKRRSKNTKISSKNKEKNLLYVVGAAIVIIILLAFVVKFSGKPLTGKVYGVVSGLTTDGNSKWTISVPSDDPDYETLTSGNELMFLFGDENGDYELTIGGVNMAAATPTFNVVSFSKVVPESCENDGVCTEAEHGLGECYDCTECGVLVLSVGDACPLTGEDAGVCDNIGTCVPVEDIVCVDNGHCTLEEQDAGCWDCITCGILQLTAPGDECIIEAGAGLCDSEGECIVEGDTTPKACDVDEDCFGELVEYCDLGLKMCAECSPGSNSECKLITSNFELVGNGVCGQDYMCDACDDTNCAPESTCETFTEQDLIDAGFDLEDVSYIFARFDPVKLCVEQVNPCLNVICAPGLVCDPEAPELCVPQPGAECGDGFLNEGEICDDGNTEGEDGCRGDCLTIESGFECPTPGELCVPIEESECGNGVCDAGEEGVCSDDCYVDMHVNEEFSAINPDVDLEQLILNDMQICVENLGTMDYDGDLAVKVSSYSTGDMTAFGPDTLFEESEFVIPISTYDAGGDCVEVQSFFSRVVIHESYFNQNIVPLKITVDSTNLADELN